MLCFGNISVVGVILSYQDPATVPRGVGYNPTPREVGERVNDALVELLQAGRVRPLVSKVVPFEDVPSALEAMSDRATMGRVVIQISG